MTNLTILVCSAGRRPYLPRWFKNVELEGVDVTVILADADGQCPAGPFADVFVPAPVVTDDGYDNWLESVIEQYGIDLAVSVNDFELSHWANSEWSERTSRVLVRLTSQIQSIFEDKLKMSEFLGEAGILTPFTTLAGEDHIKSHHRLASSDRVVKGRFGSGSRGLRMTDLDGLTEAIGQAANEVSHRDGTAPSSLSEAKDLIVVQDRIRGQEFGLDIVNDLHGKFVTVLARKKLSMRAGETDKAISVLNDQFLEVGQMLSSQIRHSASIDADVIVDLSGQIWVIDVNPRIGGGYPFSHLAGANVPRAMVSWAAGRSTPVEVLDYRVGTTGAKYVEVGIVSE